MLCFRIKKIRHLGFLITIYFVMLWLQFVTISVILASFLIIFIVPPFILFAAISWLYWLDNHGRHLMICCHSTHILKVRHSNTMELLYTALWAVTQVSFTVCNSNCSAFSLISEHVTWSVEVLCNQSFSWSHCCVCAWGYLLFVASAACKLL